jgi:putative DNA primase/helicase
VTQSHGPRGTGRRPPRDFAGVARVALGAVASVLAHWLPGGQRRGREYLALNPNRSDARVGSFSVNTETGAWADFAGDSDDRGGDLVALVAFVDRCTQAEAADRLAAFLGLATAPGMDGAAAAGGTTDKRERGASREASAAVRSNSAGAWVGPTPDDAPAAPAAHPHHGRPSARWTYRDAQGRALFHVCRFDSGAGKEVLPLSLWRIGDALRWRWKGAPTPRPLYGLDRLTARAAAPALACEGEKDADAAAELLPEFVAITSPNGAKSAGAASWAPLAGRRVCVWPDADTPGAAYAADVAKRAHAAGAASVAVLRLDRLAALRGAALPDGWGAADALAEGIAPEAMAELFATADAWSIVPAPGERSMRKADDRSASERAAASGTARRGGFHCVQPGNGDGRRPGVYWSGVTRDKSGEFVELPPEWVCSPLTIAAATRDGAGGEWGRLLVFPDRDGSVHRWAMPMTLLARGGDELREELYRMGVEITPDPNRRRRLLDYIQGAEPPLYARCVTRTGWHGNAFVLPGETFGDSERAPVIFQSATPDAAKIASAGTFDAWRAQVAEPCAGNSRLVLVLSMGFASACLGLVGAEGGGLHLRGPSSAGKSTALAVAASIFGPPEYRKKWRQTDNALESVAALHSDLLLPLDEIGQLDPRHAASVAYLLANGQGKSRARRDGSLRAPATWRLLFVSGGEIGLSDLMTEAGGKQRAGMEVRVIDLPADAGAGLGIFDAVPPETAAGAFADRIRAAAAANYGHALPAFLRALVAEFDKARAFMRSAVAAMAVELAGDDAAGQVRRVAQRFALCAAAGELASVYGLTGWPQGEAERAARRCFADWLDARGTKGASEPRAMLEQVRHFLGQHGEARFAPWERAQDDRAPKTLMRCGWRRATNDGPEFFVFAESFRREVCAGFDPVAVARVLAHCGALKPDSNGAGFTRKERLPDDTFARVYRITPAIWEAEA